MFHFGQNNVCVASASCQGSGVCHLGSSGLQSWAAEVAGACFQILGGRESPQLRNQCYPVCQLVRGSVEEVRNSCVLREKPSCLSLNGMSVVQRRHRVMIAGLSLLSHLWNGRWQGLLHFPTFILVTPTFPESDLMPFISWDSCQMLV